jgi:hypothetical protein
MAQSPKHDSTWVQREARRGLLLLSVAFLLGALAITVIFVRSFWFQDVIYHCADGVNERIYQSARGAIHFSFNRNPPQPIGPSWQYWRSHDVGIEFINKGINPSRWIPLQIGAGKSAFVAHH